ncbi:platelet glycoprotein Ib alpha chain [Spea bombifrons]|uniref:platelet glycoprotein Ib alpha chain n=1 Tax=Spea bombifrons TaxID=233779 RepID=UPI00234B231A|nr:platelet glycoprotein Ib alpha chain [Spea bombifrons]
MRSLALWELLVLLLVGNGSSAKPSCSTQKDKLDKVETSCTNLGLTGIPLDGIPTDTQILILSFNSLKSVSTSSFKSFPQLVELDLSNNGMSVIDVDLPLKLEDLNLANNSFDKLPKLSQLNSLVKLDLSNNRIVTVPDAAFHGLKKLKSLYLQANKIQDLPDKVFEGLQLLETLDLSSNELWQVPQHLIYDSVRMEKFHLSGNRLTEIPDLFFEGLDNLAYVYLDKNPWNCNCALAYFKDWVEENEHNIYTIVSGTPVNDGRSVLCSNKLPLLDYSTEHCKSTGDAGPGVAKTERQPSTEVPTTSATTPVETTSLETTKMPTTEVQTTTLETTTLATTEVPTTTLETTTLATTEVPTTTLETTTLATTEVQTTTPETTTQLKTTSKAVIPTTTVEHTSLETTQLTTTEVVSTHHTTTPESSTKMTTSTPSPTTTRWTEETPTRPASTLTVPLTTTATSLYPTTQTPAPAEIDVPVAPVAMKHWRLWLVETIIRHCCFLHFLLYTLIVGGLVLQIVVCLGLLVWGYTSYNVYFQILTQKAPGVRLTRYSQRISRNEDEILLVHDGHGDSTFTDGSAGEPVPILLLEARSRENGRRFTSAILP